MAKLYAVAIRDSAAGAFNRPFFVPTVGFAIRSFRDECNRQAPDNPMYNHPADFELYQLGYYQEETGVLISDVLSQPLARAIDMKE